MKIRKGRNRGRVRKREGEKEAGREGGKEGRKVGQQLRICASSSTNQEHPLGPVLIFSRCGTQPDLSSDCPALRPFPGPYFYGSLC